MNGYFNGFAISVFAAATLTVAAGSLLTGANAVPEPQRVIQQETGVQALGHARAVSWISTGHIVR